MFKMLWSDFENDNIFNKELLLKFARMMNRNYQLVSKNN
jgi:hypothetical protein